MEEIPRNPSTFGRPGSGRQTAQSHTRALRCHGNVVSTVSRNLCTPSTRRPTWFYLYGGLRFFDSHSFNISINLHLAAIFLWGFYSIFSYRRPIIEFIYVAFKSRGHTPCYLLALVEKNKMFRHIIFAPLITCLLSVDVKIQVVKNKQAKEWV